MSRIVSSFIMRLAKTQLTSSVLKQPVVALFPLESYSYRSVASILKNGLDSAPLPGQAPPSQPGPTHENLRGPDYYQ